MKTKMWCKNIKLTKNKSIEIQLDLFPQDDSTIFSCEFRANQKTDHAGIGLFLTIYKFVYFHIQLYDHRHWDWENKCWEELIFEMVSCPQIKKSEIIARRFKEKDESKKDS